MYCKYMRFDGFFITLAVSLGWNDNILNDLQLVKVGFIHIHKAHSGQNWRFQFWMIFNHRPRKPQQWKGHLRQEYPSCVSASNSLGCGSEVCQNFNDMPANAAALPQISWHRYSILPSLFWLPNGIGEYAVLDLSWRYAQDSPVHQNFNHRPAKAAALPRISEPMSHILTQILHIA